MSSGTAMSFEPIGGHEPGVLARMLRESYAALLAEAPQYWSKEVENWNEFDRVAFAEMDTVGACVFVTCVDDRPIGFGSYDPRRVPGEGRVGHHCILPAWRGRGFGRRQMEEIVRRLERHGAAEIRTMTGEHLFFEPARRTYLACGFRECGRSPGGPDPRYGTIRYEKLFERLLEY